MSAIEREDPEFCFMTAQFPNDFRLVGEVIFAITTANNIFLKYFPNNQVVITYFVSRIALLSISLHHKSQLKLIRICCCGFNKLFVMDP
jgi:hypothetical protein